MLSAREQLALKVDGWLQRSAPWLHLIGRAHVAAAPATRRQRSHSWMTLPLRLEAHAPVGMSGLIKHLERHGVETRPIIAGNLARHPAVAHLKTRSAESLVECDRLLARGLMIGCHPKPSAGALDTLERAIAALAAL